MLLLRNQEIALGGHKPGVAVYDVHGVPVHLDCQILSLHLALEQLLGVFLLDQISEEHVPDAGQPVCGTVRSYVQAEVLKHLSPTAVRLAVPEQDGRTPEIYQEGERFWLVDDRWGMSEVNLLKGTWRSWVLPHTSDDGLRCAEAMIVWPMAQLLRARNLYLLPSAGLARDGWGVLLISSLPIEPELTHLIRCGYRLIGQRWTALRENSGRLEMLHMPGQVEHTSAPRLRGTSEPAPTDWIDLAEEFPGVTQASAGCDAVVIIEPRRRPHAHVNELSEQLALNCLRQHWPFAELHRMRRQLPLKLAQRCRCALAQASRCPEDLVVMLETLRPTLNDGARIDPRRARRYVPSMIKAS